MMRWLKLGRGLFLSNREAKLNYQMRVSWLQQAQEKRWAGGAIPWRKNIFFIYLFDAWCEEQIFDLFCHYWCYIIWLVFEAEILQNQSKKPYDKKLFFHFFAIINYKLQCNYWMSNSIITLGTNIHNNIIIWSMVMPFQIN